MLELRWPLPYYAVSVGEDALLIDDVIDANAIAGDSVSTVEYFDPFAGRWQLASSMCTLRSRVGIAVFKGVYVFVAVR